MLGVLAHFKLFYHSLFFYCLFVCLFWVVFCFALFLLFVFLGGGRGGCQYIGLLRIGNVLLSLSYCIVSFYTNSIPSCALEEIHYHSDDNSNLMMTSLCLV